MGPLDRLRRLLRVPWRPAAPAGRASSVRFMRASRRSRDLVLIRWGARQLAALVGLVTGFLVLRDVDLPAAGWIDWAERAAFFVWLLQGLATLIVALLDWNTRWYVVTDRSLRIREGVLTVRELTMSYTNIQNLEVRQGPLARLLGIADLEVRAAGGGGQRKPKQGEGAGHDLHVARFRGVDDANAIRDVILARMKQVADAGLGDTDERQPAGAAPGDEALAAADVLLAEVRRLGARLAPR
jgi:membrane protein YdbS with pleckstrin-like domain